MPVILPSSLPSLDVRVGDCRELLREMPAESVQCCVTSPPYFGLRDYGHEGQIGLEDTPEKFVEALVNVFREVRRVLRDDGTLWLNLGDSYCNAGSSRNGEGLDGKQRGGAKGKGLGYKKRDPRYAWAEFGIKHKDLIGIPWRVAFALQQDGWYLRQDIIWHKPNPMPESVKDRCTKAHEYIFLLSKKPKYWFDHEAMKEPISEGSQRPQQRRARQLVKEKGLTTEHIAAVKAAGCTDAGKSRVTQSGTGKNTEEVTRLAEEAKEALGGYYRELLTDCETRNRRSVWTVATKPFKGAHFAVFPPDLIEPCIMAGTKPGDVVLDPFGGSGTTGQVALELGRRAILCELNPDYAEIIHSRTNVTMGLGI